MAVSLASVTFGRFSVATNWMAENTVLHRSSYCCSAPVAASDAWVWPLQLPHAYPNTLTPAPCPSAPGGEWPPGPCDAGSSPHLLETQTHHSQVPGAINLDLHPVLLSSLELTGKIKVQTGTHSQPWTAVAASSEAAVSCPWKEAHTCWVSSWTDLSGRYYILGHTTMIHVTIPGSF